VLFHRAPVYSDGVVVRVHLVDPTRSGAPSLAAVSAEPESLAVRAVPPLVLARILSNGVVATARQLVRSARETDPTPERERVAFPAEPPVCLTGRGGRVEGHDI